MRSSVCRLAWGSWMCIRPFGELPRRVLSFKYPNSIRGHWAGGPPGNMEDVKWLDERLAKYFASAPKRDGTEEVTEGVKKL